jgi:hypothetical protein
VRQPVSVHRDAGAMRAVPRIRRIAPAPMRCPSRVSSPWMRRCPQRGFSRANRTTRSRSSSSIGGRRRGGNPTSVGPAGDAISAACPVSRRGANVARGATAASTPTSSTIRTRRTRLSRSYARPMKLGIGVGGDDARRYRRTRSSISRRLRAVHHPGGCHRRRVIVTASEGLKSF